MKNAKPVVLVVTAGAVVAVAFLLVGHLFDINNEQRLASCKATIISLDAVSETAAAGIRPVPNNNLDLDNKLTQLFEQQRAATRAENTRRRIVIARVNKAYADLAHSDFCSS